MVRTAGVALVTVLCAVRVAGAQQLTATTLGSWLCQAVPSDRPERALPVFPGAPAARVEPTVGKLWRDRPGRLASPTRYAWRVPAGAFDLEYRHDEQPGRKYGFLITIRPARGRGNVRIFTSPAEIRRWLGRLGGRLSSEDGLDDVRQPDGSIEKEENFIRPNIEAVGHPKVAGANWRVTVGTDWSSVSVGWTEVADKQFARGFCS